jgi:cell wall-associated NlpC family hydrolase
LAVAAVLATALPAGADSVSDKQHQAQQIAARIDQLGQRAADLGEGLNGAKLQLDQAQNAVKTAEDHLAAQEQKLGALRSSMSTFAVKAYIYADQESGLAGLLAGTSTTEGAAQREGYQAVALGANLDVTDQARAVIADTQRQRDQLAVKQAQAAKLADGYSAAQKQANDALAAQQKLQISIKGELATLVAEQQQAQVKASQAAATAVLQRTQPVADPVAPAVPAPIANVTKPTTTSTSAPVKPAVTSTTAAAKPAPKAAPIVNIPATSPGAAIAVRAALSQVGVAYRFAAASPGVAFDCSGLTMWAWAQAGVGLPHYSKSQYQMLPRVPLDAMQPGDLVFFYSDVSHVGIYIGNGQMIHAASPGVGVVISGIGPSAIGAGRP